MEAMGTELKKRKKERKQQAFFQCFWRDQIWGDYLPGLIPNLGMFDGFGVGSGGEGGVPACQGHAMLIASFLASVSLSTAFRML